MGLVEELPHRAGHDRAYIGNLEQRLLGRREQGRQVAVVAGEVAGSGVADVADAQRVDKALERGVL
jgi:hypothetical protein